MLRSAVLVAAVLVPAAIASAQGLQQKPSLTLGDGVSRAELAFKERGKGKNAHQVARFTALVRNESAEKGALEIVFLRPRWFPRRPMVPADREGSGKRLELIWENRSTSASIGPQDATPVVLLFRLPSATPPAAATGHLRIRLAGSPSVGSILLPVAPATSAATARFDQPKSTMRVTRWCGFLTRPIRSLTDRECLTDERLPLSVSGSVPTKRTLLSSDRGKTLVLHLEGGPDPALRTEKIGGPGTYEGQIVLDPNAEKPQSVQATVKARDAIVWPLLVIAVGVFVAGVLRYWQTVWRGRRVLRGRLKAAVEPYLKRRMPPDGRGPKRPLTSDERERRDMYQPLNAQLQTLGNTQFPKGAGCSPVTLPRVPALFCAIAKARSSERLSELEGQIAEVETLFRRGMQVFAAFDQLSEAASRLDGRLPIKRDAEDVLDLATSEPSKDEEAAAFAARMRQQALITILYREVGRRYARLPDKWKAPLSRFRPFVLYGEAGKALTLRRSRPPYG